MISILVSIEIYLRLILDAAPSFIGGRSAVELGANPSSSDFSHLELSRILSNLDRLENQR